VSAALLRLFGVQPEAYRVLVRTFWRMSMRQSPALVGGANRDPDAAMAMGWLLYALFGLMVGTLVFLKLPREVFAAAVACSATFFVGITAIADFGVLVMAPGDDEVLFHHPLRPQTYLAARLTVASLHAALLAGVFGAFPALFSFRYGDPVYPVLFLLSLVAAAWFALLFAFLVYRSALRLLGGPRMERMLTFVPALFSILAYLVPQLLVGRLHEGAGERLLPLLDYLPPAWFTAIPELCLGPRDAGVVRRALLGIVVLPAGWWLLVAALGRGLLADLLAQLATRGGARGTRGRRRRPVLGGAFLPRDPEAAAGYLLHAGALRSRDARTRSLPALLMPLAFVLIGLVRDRGGGLNALMAIYLLGVGMGTLLAVTVWHEHHAAAWIYGAVPVRRYGRFLAGVVRAIVVRNVLPLFLVCLAVALVQDPSPVTLAGGVHALLGGGLALPVVAGTLRSPPFSRRFEKSESLAQTGIFLGAMLLVAVPGVVHFLVAEHLPLLFAATIPLLAFVDLVWLRAVLARADRAPPPPIRPAQAGARPRSAPTQPGS